MINKEPGAFEKYPLSTVLLTNIVNLVICVIGVYLVWQLGMIWGIVHFGMNIEGNLAKGISLVVISVLFLVIVIYFSNVLLGNSCKKCANFSCAMNKVPKEIIDAFLKKNPEMKEAWIKSGWEFD